MFWLSHKLHFLTEVKIFNLCDNEIVKNNKCASINSNVQQLFRAALVIMPIIWAALKRKLSHKLHFLTEVKIFNLCDKGQRLMDESR